MARQQKSVRWVAPAPAPVGSSFDRHHGRVPGDDSWRGETLDYTPKLIGTVHLARVFARDRPVPLPFTKRRTGLLGSTLGRWSR